MEVYGYVYLMRNQVNGKVYIGQTNRSIDLRVKEHGYHSKRGARYINKAVRKYGIEAFDIAELGRAFSKEELNEMETRAIWSHESDNPEYGYNLTKGGEGTVGFRHADETKKFLSLHHQLVPRDHTWTNSRREHMSKKMKNRTYSDEALANMREGRKKIIGRKPTKEQADKQTAALREVAKQKVYRPNKTSGFIGVNKNGNNWIARITVDGIRLNKTFKTAEEAARWRDEQALVHHSDYPSLSSNLNFPQDVPAVA